MTQPYIHGSRTYAGIDSYTDPQLRAAVEAMATDELQARTGHPVEVTHEWTFWHVEEILGGEEDFFEIPVQNPEDANAAILITEVKTATSVTEDEDHD